MKERSDADTQHLTLSQRWKAIATALLLATAGFCIEAAGARPPLHVFDTIHADAAGQSLQDAMIWTSPAPDDPGVAVVFRKTFELGSAPTAAALSIFADARYVLWINGTYVDRGPSRFQPNGPQYDVLDVGAHLRSGHNALAILVVGNLSGGKVMRHAPGLTAILEADGKPIARTDASWKWTDQTRFRKVVASWADMWEAVVDARVEDGDWTQADYNDSAWKPASKIDGSGWGPLTRTLIPRLRETEVPLAFSRGATLPVTLQSGQKLEWTTTRLVQAYPVIELEAQSGAELELAPFRVQYLARSGRQKHFSIDTRGLRNGTLTVKSGEVTITGFKLIERLYPYQRMGAFQCNDEFLNKLWEMCARSCEVLSEDAYVDCADRERVEWMDCTPPGFDVTRVLMAGLGADGKPMYSDPRLLGQMVRRTGLTLQPDGWVKAHTCSDRHDIHAKMEDRACEWVAGVRYYYEATGDASIVREIWPAIVAQMDYFLQRRTPRGLVAARDWVVWGNPVGYFQGEGTTLNVFVQRALVDAAFLGGLIARKADSERFAKAAAELEEAINTVLWDEKQGGYYSGYFDDDALAAAARGGFGYRARQLPQPIDDHRTAMTLHANVFALDRGVVPAQRRARVVATLLEQEPQNNANDAMLRYYIFKQLYALDRPECDARVLEEMRKRWAPMAASPLQCSWEGLSGSRGSKAHIYGMYPGYFLSSYVLGVRWKDGVPLNRKLLIEPHLAGLTSAQGTVVTEAGPTPVAWTRTAGGGLELKVTVPTGVTAELRLPTGPRGKFVIDNQPATGRREGNRCVLSLTPGEHAGAAK